MLKKDLGKLCWLKEGGHTMFGMIEEDAPERFVFVGVTGGPTPLVHDYFEQENLGCLLRVILKGNATYSIVEQDELGKIKILNLWSLMEQAKVRGVPKVQNEMFRELIQA